jgi:tRNA A-37 threonylcarbamoyl transferase component Bud32
MSGRDASSGPRGTLKMGSGPIGKEQEAPRPEDEHTPIDAPRFDFDAIAKDMLAPEVYQSLGIHSGIRAVAPSPELFGPEFAAAVMARSGAAYGVPTPSPPVVGPSAVALNHQAQAMHAQAVNAPGQAPRADEVALAATELANELPKKIDTAPAAVGAAHDAARDSGDLLRIGDRVGAYLVVAKMAEGGMGEIYEVRHTVAQKTFALKALQRSFHRRSDIVDRLLAEAKLMMDCRGNPNICEVQEIAHDPRLGHYIVMEKLEGKNLGDVLNGYHQRQKTMDITTAMGIALHAADALHVMHQLGAIHRDIKPDNIFLVDKPDGGIRVVILDWGAAKSQHVPKTTDPSMTIATLSYMSPEQCRRRRPTAASDQYSLAFVIYEMLFEHPFAEAIAQNPYDPGLFLSWHLLSEVEPPPPEVCPPALFAILKKAMNKEPSQRYPSMRDFAAAIRSFLSAPHAHVAPPAAGARRHATIQAGRGYVQRWKNLPQVPLQIGPQKRRVPVAEVCAFPTLLLLAPMGCRGMRFELGDRGILGRHQEEADLLVPNDTLSNRHAKYALVAGSTPEEPYFTMEDLGSKNGTFLRDAPCDVAVVRSLEPIRFGDVLGLIVPAGGVSADLKQHIPLRTMASIARGEPPRKKPESLASLLFRYSLYGIGAGLLFLAILISLWTLFQ